MRHWSIWWRSEEIYGTPATLHLEEVPWWALLGSRAAEALDAVVGHKWCDPPEWAWGIELGRQKDGDKRYLGTILWNTFAAAAALDWTFRRDIKELPLSRLDLEAIGEEDPF